MDELNQYISQHKQAGTSDDDIRHELLAAGWPEDIINQHLGYSTSIKVKGERNLIWAVLIPVIIWSVGTLNNIIVQGYIIPHNIGSSPIYQTIMLPVYLLLAQFSWIAYFASFILFGLGCARYAREKGYWAGWGWILGLILNIIGLIILALLPKRSFGHPEKILTRRYVILVISIVAVMLSLYIWSLFYINKHANELVPTPNPSYSSEPVPSPTSWIHFPGDNYGATFDYPSNLFDIYDSLAKCGVGTCPTFTQYLTIGGTKYWFAGLFAGQGKSGSMTVSLLLDHNDIQQIAKLLSGNNSLVSVPIGNKFGYEFISMSGACSEIYYIAPGGTIKSIQDLGQGHNGNNIIVINFDGCSTGMALNQNQNLIKKIVDTFSTK